MSVHLCKAADFHDFALMNLAKVKIHFHEDIAGCNRLRRK